MTASLSIVVPAFNEAGRLGQSLRAILDYLNKTNPHAELIVVDDGSDDETRVIAEQALANAGRINARVITYQANRGKGYAVRCGLLACEGRIALFSDADLSTPVTETPKLVDPIEQGEYDLTFGSRALDRRVIGGSQTLEARAGRPDLQPGRAAGDRLAVLGHPVRL